MALPTDQLERDDLAVIVPAFELSSGRECGSFDQCAVKLESALPFNCSAARRIPKDKESLKKCMEMKKCNTFRPKERLHISLISLIFGILHKTIIFLRNGIQKITNLF